MELHAILVVLAITVAAACSGWATAEPATMPATQPSDELLSDIKLAAWGSLNIDHIGPARYAEVRNRLSRNARLANQVLSERYVRSTPTETLSRMSIESVLAHTSEGDPRGALSVALDLQRIINERLRSYDDAADKDRYLRGLTADARGEIERLISHRRQLQPMVKSLSERASTRPAEKEEKG